jgi:hypothetical protein
MQRFNNQQSKRPFSVAECIPPFWVFMMEYVETNVLRLFSLQINLGMFAEQGVAGCNQTEVL